MMKNDNVNDLSPYYYYTSESARVKMNRITLVNRIKPIDPNMKLCVNCKHFVLDEGIKKAPYLGRCKVFGWKDCVTGKVEYAYASVVRNCRTKCGEDAKYYEPVYVDPGMKRN